MTNGLRGLRTWLEGAALRQGLALLALAVSTSLVALAYAYQPSSPLDLLDRTVLLLNGDAFGPTVRVAERSERSARLADREGSEELADSLFWTAAHHFARAGSRASGPQDAIRAHDRAARLYLELGYENLSRGRGRILGIGRRPEALKRAELAAACVRGLAPTSARADIDRFVEEVESVLERPVAARCPR